MISNGKLIGAEHRVVTNSSKARTTVAYFIQPSFESIIGPAQELINGSNPPLYKSTSFGEFSKSFLDKGPKIEEDLES